MQLTQDQIQDLYRFTEKKHVEWYELQTEMVDHLANAIENIWEEDATLSYIQARNKAYSKFGIFGFSEVVGQKESALFKNYWREIWRHFKSFIQPPKIILTFLLIAIVYSVLLVVKNKDLFFKIGFSLTLLVPFALATYNIVAVRLRQRKTQRKWMFENIIYSYGGLIYLMIQVPNFIFRDYSINWSFDNELLFSTLLTLTGVLAWLIVIVLPKKMTTSIEKQYPEYRLHKKA